MTTVTITKKFQLEIPARIRKRLKLIPGQKVQVIEYDNRLEYIPIHSIEEMRGLLKGMDTILKI